ncbi:UNVERIFIED_CONTAM: 28S ribosomal protein S21, mitochondrial [Gekko kuhli]
MAVVEETKLLNVTSDLNFEKIPRTEKRKRDLQLGGSAWGGRQRPRLRGEKTGTANMVNHMKFIAQTVMVPDGNVEVAYRVLNRILTMDGTIAEAQQHRYYEKPCRRRQRVAYETCRRIYNTEMARKINFLMRKNRPDPWLGC